MPELSVLMSTYNSKKYVKDSIESVLNQTYSDFEFIIVNDGSTDNTEKVIRTYQDSRIKLYNLNENIGVGSALKYGLEQVTGKYVIKMDSDDISYSTRFEKQKIFLDNHPEIALVKCLVEYFPHDLKTEQSPRYRYMKSAKEKCLNDITTPEQISKTLYWWSCIPHDAIAVRTGIIKEIGYREVRMGEDYSLFYNINKRGYKMDTVNEVLLKIRVIDTSICGAEQDQAEFTRILFEIKRDELINFIKDKSVYIWGTGGLGENLVAVLENNGYNVAGFIDRDEKKHGTSIFGKPIFSPSYIRESNGAVTKIIIAAQPARYEIAHYLDQIGYQDTVDYFVFA